ncbi:Protein THO1 [Hanseniaspora osmophila]|uniref:Protein THO1 n=1 Tax=Hanseniaspora osmophila TaxID=56408 RepID=A0A1E5RBW8_9ASCO|nr:Protein THO1 [Hanseniaspora osmophila]
MVDLQTLKVADLKEILKKHNLPTTGFKKDLIERLEENKISGDDDDGNASANASTSVNVSAPEPQTETDTGVTEIQRVEDTSVPVTAPNTASASYTSTSTENQPVGSNTAYESSSFSTITETVQMGNEPPKSVERKVVSETVPTGKDHGQIGDSTTTTTTTTTVSATNFTKEELKAKAVELLNVKIKRALKFGETEEADKLNRDLKRIEKFGFDPTTSIAKDLGLFKRDKTTIGRLGSSGVKKNNNNNNNNNNNRRGSNGNVQKKKLGSGRR